MQTQSFIQEITQDTEQKNQTFEIVLYYIF